MDAGRRVDLVLPRQLCRRGIFTDRGERDPRLRRRVDLPSRSLVHRPLRLARRNGARSNQAPGPGIGVHFSRSWHQPSGFGGRQVPTVKRTRRACHPPQACTIFRPCLAKRPSTHAGYCSCASSGRRAQAQLRHERAGTHGLAPRPGKSLSKSLFAATTHPSGQPELPQRLGLSSLRAREDLRFTSSLSKCAHTTLTPRWRCSGAVQQRSIEL